MVVKHARYPTSTRRPLPSLHRSILVLVIVRWTNGPIPGRPLKAHSIKRVAFIPSIFTRDVSSSAAGFLAIRVTVVSAVSTFVFCPPPPLFPRNRKVLATPHSALVRLSSISFFLFFLSSKFDGKTRRGRGSNSFRIIVIDRKEYVSIEEHEEIRIGNNFCRTLFTIQ